MYLTLNIIRSLTQGSWYWIKQKVMVKCDLSPDFLEWGTGASSHLMCCLAGEGESHKLSTESQAEDRNGRNHHRFLPYWIQGEERARWWRTQTSRKQAWQLQDLPSSGFWGRCVKSEICVSYLPEGLLSLLHSKTKSLRRQIQAGGRLKGQRGGQPWSRAASSAEGWAACWEAWLAAWWWCEWKRTTQFHPCLCFGILFADGELDALRRGRWGYRFVCEGSSGNIEPVPGRRGGKGAINCCIISVASWNLYLKDPLRKQIRVECICMCLQCKGMWMMNVHKINKMQWATIENSRFKTFKF